MSQHICFTTCESTLGKILVGAGKSGICAIANRIGMPRVVRAMAQACGANPVVVAILCHRIVRRGGGLVVVFLAGLLASTSTSAQELPARDRAAAEIGATLRSFYFNLGRRDWDALTADILAAKVVAHRSAPASPGGASRSEPKSSRAAICSAPEMVSVEHAVITVRGEWAEVTVPHCARVEGQDEFRLIRFAGRWRFVSIQLQQPAEIMVGR